VRNSTGASRVPPTITTASGRCTWLPAALSTAIGSQVQRPLAIVVVGGTLLAPLLFLTVLPAAIGLFSRRTARRTARAADVAEAL